MPARDATTARAPERYEGCARHGLPRARVSQRWAEAEKARAPRIAVCLCCSGPASVRVLGEYTQGGTVYGDGVAEDGTITGPLCQLCREVETAPPVPPEDAAPATPTAEVAASEPPADDEQQGGFNLG